jgi:murein biosynthesis integral membrane protein MurJ
MLGRIFTVGGYTLLSRLAGFARDIMLAAILGAGPVADAFFVALRLPNHFRAIFAEGAFNAAFVPAYAHVHGERGEKSAKLFADRIFTLLFVSQLLLLIVAWLFMPQAMSILAPGFTEDAEQRQLAIELTRITFPYLLLITLVTLYGGMLNVVHRFASAAAAPIFLNIAMMATLALAALFPGPGHAPAWGVLIYRAFCNIFCWPATSPSMAACRGLIRSSSATMSAPSLWLSVPRRSARWERRSRYLPTTLSQPSCPPARCRLCIMPTASTSCRSA